MPKTLDNFIEKCGAPRLLINKNRRLRRQIFFDWRLFFILPVNCGSHADYQHFVVTNFRKYYPDPDALARSTWDIIERFWNLDLSFTDTFMADKYSKFSPAPRTPSCMQRSYLLSIDFKVTSLTEWAAQLKMNPLYAILSGFEPGNTPGVGTFYDFINRLWNSDYTQFFLKEALLL